MRFSQTTLLAILATTACVSAAPTASTTTNQDITIVKRENVNEVLETLSQLKTLKMKRDNLVGDEVAHLELEKRADTVLGNLIDALSSSGLIGTVFDDLTSNADLKSSILAIVKSAVQEAIVQGPTLIKAIWNSGLIQDVFNKILNDSDLRSALLAAGKALFKTALSLVKSFLGSTSTATTTAVSTSTTTAAAKRDVAADLSLSSNLVAEKRDAQILNERDVSDIVTYIVDEIKNSGLVSKLVNKVLNDPEQAISFLTSALKKGTVLVEDIFGWAKNNGLLEDGINWLEDSDNEIIQTLGKFLASSIDSGAVSSSEFDNAGSSATTSATAVATTAAATTAAATTAAITAAATDSSDDDLSFLSKYAEAGATTLYRVKRMAY